ncbi:MAG: metalloregulator ArsR/SmtB family transcription factor [Gammaproteobacteria bacterium]|nr:metalloregulator ArsR/SmtB family transcription factor [Gammaproteobacteria bacterium]
MELNQAVLQLDAAAEPSRLRLLVALLGGETSVGDLVAVLEQSQPRVSRHLRLLTEAGLVESFREGRSIFYRWSARGLDAGVASSVAAVAASPDPTIARDRERLQKLSRQRERDALRRALRAGRGRGLRVADGDTTLADLLHATLADRAGGGPFSAGSMPLGAILNVGCGSGEVLRLLLPEARLAVGTEPSGHRRQLARARLREAALPRWSIRDAEPARLPFEADAFDLVILQDVLSPARNDELQSILADAARVLRPAGRLLILDHILPTDSEVATRLGALGFDVIRRQWLPGRAPDRALFLASRPVLAPARTGTHD